MKLFRRKRRIRLYLLFLLTSIISLILFRKTAMYFLITILIGLFVYINYYIRLPFDISPVLFVSLVISRNYGFFPSVFFIFLSGIVPMVLAGGSFDHTTFFYLSIIIIVNYLSILFLKFPFILVALPLIVLHHILALVGGIALGLNPHKEILNFGIKLVVDSIYILCFSDLLVIAIS